jgi:hypothetical protein
MNIAFLPHLWSYLSKALSKRRQLSALISGIEAPQPITSKKTSIRFIWNVRPVGRTETADFRA